jgi:pimeloyl-ACP methyl ester carboxylesterase
VQFVPAARDGTPARWRVNLQAIHDCMGELSAFPIAAPPAPPSQAFPKPTLFVYGLKSDYVVDAQLPTIHALFPRARLQAFDAGHWLHSEAPTAFVAALAVFADRA